MPETNARCPFDLSIDKKIFKGLIFIFAIEVLIDEEENISSMCAT